MKLYFVGIAGTGMSALAAFSKLKGFDTSGSDRSLSSKPELPIFDALRRLGINVYNQDGKALQRIKPDRVIVSTAIEESNPEIKISQELNIPIVRRAELLAEFFNENIGVGVSGTSGKTTTTGIISQILVKNNLKPDVLCGDRIKGIKDTVLDGRCMFGDGRYFVAEVDESDGSIIYFHPELGIITNISRDHKELDELIKLFRTFFDNCKRKCIMDNDTARVLGIIRDDKLITAGFTPLNEYYPEDVEYHSLGTNFSFRGRQYSLHQPGRYNLQNAIYALTVADIMHLLNEETVEGVGEFQGIRRRFEHIGRCRGIDVFDDFAHNPHKINAVLKMTELFHRPRILIFQPHGYKPLQFMFKEFKETFCENLTKKDMLVLLPVYDAGGSTDRSIQSDMLADELKRRKVDVYYAKKGREDCLGYIKEKAREGDIVLLLGARDPTLEFFAQAIYKTLFFRRITIFSNDDSPTHRCNT